MARPADLAAELAAAVCAVGSRDRLRLADYGLGAAEALAIGAVGVARVHLERGGLYRPDPDGGEPAIILPAWPGALADLVAWRPWASERVLARRLGTAVALGEPEFSGFLDDGAALRLWRSPASWAAAGCRGAVVIDWRGAARELVRFPRIVAEDLELAEAAQQHIRAELRRVTPRAPLLAIAG